MLGGQERFTVHSVQVLMSTYNGERYIIDQLESIFNQTCQEIRLYIRDDGSTDSTIEK